MRTKSADSSRTMSQKILAGHADEEHGGGDFVEVRVDQVVLAREPNRVLGRAVLDGLTQSRVEVSIAYPPHCIALGAADVDPRAPHLVSHDALDLGFLVAQPGAGFASAIHLERFGSPARLVLTDEPRLSNTGGAGMLSLPASVNQLSEALRTGKTWVRPPRSVQVLLTGRLRPFVCMRDVALDMLRRGLKEIVQMVDAEYHAPVVLEMGGPSARFLSVAERAVLCAMAPRLGAAGALFGSDEKTEIFLRDQKRSKAHRTLSADVGAPWDQVLSLDLGAVDPLVMDEEGRIRPVRDFDGKPVSQVILGGDSGVTLRDLLAAAALLKSKRVPPRVEFLFSPPSRQILEVLARSDALVDLIATGARLIEPDRRALSGELYPPRPGGVSLHSSDPEISQRASVGLVASAETLAFAIAHGEVGDPRNFKRPVRVAVPRNLPTDDVLLARGPEQRGGAKGKGRVDKKAARNGVAPSSERFGVGSNRPTWEGSTELSVVGARTTPTGPSALVTESSEDIQWVVENAAVLPGLRAVIAPHVPTAVVSVLSGLGILVLQADASSLGLLEGARVLQVPAPASWRDGPFVLGAGNAQVPVRWLALGPEREWAL